MDLHTVTPSPFAVQVAKVQEKDPQIVEVVLRETKRVVKMAQRTIIAETHHGFVCANAGVDESNVAGEGTVALLPVDADASARRLRQAIRERTGVELAVIISDTFGRPWREGLVNVAIGVAGMEPLKDYRGLPDTEGRILKVTTLAVADELASAAELVMGKLDRVPVAVIRGYPYTPGEGAAAQLRARARKRSVSVTGEDGENRDLGWHRRTGAWTGAALGHGRGRGDHRFAEPGARGEGCGGAECRTRSGAHPRSGKSARPPRRPRSSS